VKQASKCFFRSLKFAENQRGKVGKCSGQKFVFKLPASAVTAALQYGSGSNKVLRRRATPAPELLL
jgi:hypothetical protein